MTRTLGMFPLSTVLFPHAGLPLHVFEERYRELMADCLGRDAEFGVVLIARGSEVGGGDQRVNVGTVARISDVSELVDGRMMVMAHGVERIRVCRWLSDDPYPRATVDELPDAMGSGHDHAVTRGGEAVRRLRSLLSELGDVPALPHDLAISGTVDEIGWQLCQLAPLNLIDRQQLLSSGTLAARMDLLAELCDAMAADVVGLLAGGLGG
jgi:Lon protease-like protein